MLLAYAEMLEADFGQYSEEERLSYILMNNVQQARIQLAKMFHLMGGQGRLDRQACAELKRLQEKLNAVLQRMTSLFVRHLKGAICESVR